MVVHVSCRKSKLLTICISPAKSSVSGGNEFPAACEGNPAANRDGESGVFVRDRHDTKHNSCRIKGIARIHDALPQPHPELRRCRDPGNPRRPSIEEAAFSRGLRLKKASFFVPKERRLCTQLRQAALRICMTSATRGCVCVLFLWWFFVRDVRLSAHCPRQFPAYKSRSLD